jgi:hypothetical protein
MGAPLAPDMVHDDDRDEDKAKADGDRHQDHAIARA